MSIKRQPKVLFLGASIPQIPVIKYAVDAGYVVYTTDYLPHNPGHKLASQSFDISTIDKEAVLELAQQLDIDGIVAYASDPAAPTASYVSEKLGLPGNSYESVLTLSDKGLFRGFLRDNGFSFPEYQTFRCIDEGIKYINANPHKDYFVKPVDSSGSKGVFELSSEKMNPELLKKALSFSRKGEIIIEEKIPAKGPHIHGEGFVNNGKLEFVILGDQYFSLVNNNIPCLTTFPSIKHQDIMDQAISLVQIVIKKVGFRCGGINIELIRMPDDNISVLEISARSGGSFMPQLANYATGFAYVEAIVETSLGRGFDKKRHEPPKYFSQLSLYSFSDGIFHGINLPDNMKNHVIESNLYYKPGDRVKKYSSARDDVGVLIFTFDNFSEYSDFQEFVNSEANTIIT